jgi:CheY-like chemotaxis protein
MLESAIAETTQADNTVWKILVVDDEPAIHQVTKLALRNLSVQGRPSQLINALSAKDARDQLAKHPDIAVVLLDVVMETEDAGLEFIKHIRGHAANALIRIILRTGQPGQAPERQVMIDFDINDYKEKTELTASKLYTTVMSSIRTFGHLQEMESWRHGAEVLGHLNQNVFATADEQSLAEALVGQLSALDLFSGVSCWQDAQAAGPVCSAGASAPPGQQRTLVHTALAAPGTVQEEATQYAVALSLPGGATLVFCMASAQTPGPQSRHLLELWVQSVGSALAHWVAHA